MPSRVQTVLMFLLHHCKQLFTRTKKYNKEVLALNTEDVILTFFLFFLKKHFKTGLAYKLCALTEPQVYSFNKIF